VSIQQLIDMSGLISRHCILISPIFCTVAVVDSSALTFHRVTRQHMGSYLCIASNGVPPTVSKRITLIVHCTSSKFKNNLYHNHNIYHIDPIQLICTYNYSWYFSSRSHGLDSKSTGRCFCGRSIINRMSRRSIPEVHKLLVVRKRKLTNSR